MTYGMPSISLILLCGAKPKVVSEALGHSSVAFTIDLYSHILEGVQEDSMALLDEVLPVEVNRVKNIINANFVSFNTNILIISLTGR